MTLTTLLVGVVSLGVGTALGYYARQTLLRRRSGTLEARVQKKQEQAKEKAQKIIKKAKKKADKIKEKAKKEYRKKRDEISKADKLLLKREHKLDERFSRLEEKESQFKQKVRQLKQLENKLKKAQKDVNRKLQDVAGMSKEEAKRQLMDNLEQQHEQEILAKMRELEQQGWEKYEEKAKEMLATAIQKCSVDQAQEITTTTVSLPDDDIKGRIIGKEGRNINALEKETGVEVVVDDTPGVVVISGFDPIRRQVAKTALESLIEDGRIQPSRIEDEVKKAENEIDEQIKKAGQAAVYKVEIADLHPKLVKLLGRLHYRTSFGQNVLLHSIETAFLAQTLASEMGARPEVAKKAGLLHDIGKAVDHEVEGSHVNIGMRILNKFGIEQEVINAMRSHHEDYPAENVEATLVQAADAISGARPGARKENVEEHLERLEELENLACSFNGVRKAWALHAGREVRVFVKPDQIDDLTSEKIARSIADKMEKEMSYPGKIKINVIREKRVTEYAT
ncbi:MAG: ribonuclease Y [Candidatus Paceibacterota bacterium]